MGAAVTQPWRCLRWDASTAAEQMAIDERLAAEGQPVVRLFRWSRPALSFGLRQARPSWVDALSLRAAGIETVERPTGGGIAVHGSDLSCAIVVPSAWRLRVHQLMDRVCASLCRAIEAVGVDAAWTGDAAGRARIDYCLTQPSPYAITVNARKLCGFGLRRTSTAWLVQGSLLMRAIPEAIMRAMPRSVASDFEGRAISLEAARGSRVSDEHMAEAIIEAWRATWEQAAAPAWADAHAV